MLHWFIHIIIITIISLHDYRQNNILWTCFYIILYYYIDVIHYCIILLLCI